MGRKQFRWAWLSWIILLLLIGLLIWFEQRSLSAQDNSLSTQFSHPPGSYEHDIQLIIDSGHPNTVTYFTLDGRAPGPQNGTVYSKPIRLSADEEQIVVIRAQSYLPSGESGPITSATYFMGLDTQLPLLSIIIDPEDFYGRERGIYTNHEQRGKEWERPVALTYVDNSSGESFHLGAGMRIHGGWTRFFYDKKSLRLYFREEYGARKLDFPLFGEEGQVTFDHLVLHNSDKDLLLFKNRLVERLTQQMGGFSPRSQPALVFINGEPWGIYTIRERINVRLLAENYGVPAADISDTPNNRGMQSPEQLAVDTVHWENLMTFVLENDLSDPHNYAYLQTQMDVPNFVDYYLLQMYVANSDWPHHNVHQFRPRTQGGRWEWIVWDNDFAFEQVGAQMVDHVLDVEHPLGERMEILLNKLLDNPQFRHLFLTRAADLLNTTLSPGNVSALVEEHIAELECDIDIERSRWDISRDWTEAKEHIREFASQRSAIMRGHIVESLQLPGTSQINFEQSSAGGGWVDINNSGPQALPWEGTFFQDTTIEVRAIAPGGYQFHRWEVQPNRGLEDSALISIPVTGELRLQPVFTLMQQDMPYPGDASFTQVIINNEGDIEGDWFELEINRQGGLDLRGWRVTDNDSITADDEGSLVFKNDPLLENLPAGTTVRVIATETAENSRIFTEDGWNNGVLTLYTANGLIDSSLDPWFDIGPRDNLVLLAPGPTDGFNDDLAIAYWSNHTEFSSSTFGLPPSNPK